MNGMSERERKCGSWWRGETEAERFLLYYTCLRFHYQMPASEALATARKNWPQFGPDGNLMGTVRAAVVRAAWRPLPKPKAKETPRWAIPNYEE